MAAETYIIVYTGNCAVRKTLIPPWRFCRDIHLVRDCLAVVRKHALLLSIAAGLTAFSTYASILPPLPGIFGAVGGAFAALVVTLEHLHSRQNRLSWPSFHDPLFHKERNRDVKKPSP